MKKGQRKLEAARSDLLSRVASRPVEGGSQKVGCVTFSLRAGKTNVPVTIGTSVLSILGLRCGSPGVIVPLLNGKAVVQGFGKKKRSGSMDCLVSELWSLASLD